MNRESFERQYEDDWRRLAAILWRLEKEETRWRPFAKPRRIDEDGEFPELYRRVCHQLALVRSRLYGTDLEQKLNSLVLRGHHRLYRRSGPSWREVLDFLVAGFPRLVRREARLVGLAFVLFFGPFFGMMAAVHAYPELVYSVVDPETAAQYEAMYSAEDFGERESRTDVMMFGFYIYNNVSIAFQTFAGGMIFAVGSIFFLVANGVALGTVSGHMVNVGNGERFFPFVVGHGAYELVAIALAGAAGLKLGLALVDPGRRSRREALLAAGRESIRMVYGIFAMLVLAAFVEAFWSPSTFYGADVKYAVGALAWLSVLVYFLAAGRDRAA